MRISNEDPSDQGGGLSELLRIQADFQTRLAEETLRYLRAVQGIFAPRSPGTVVQRVDAMELAASGAAGEAIGLQLEVENRQRVHVQVSPALTPLIGDAGATWFPAAELTPASALVAPDDVLTLVVSLPLPDELPAGVYRGTLVLQGFSNTGVPVTIEVSAPNPLPTPVAVVDGGEG